MMKENIRISVIVPVYNLQDDLERCVVSIMAQTYSDLEIILVDDGSTDGSRDVIQKLADMDGRIVPVYKENGGVTSARLAGLRKATGEYIGFVDGDDEIEPDMYERLLHAYMNSDVDVVQCGYYFHLLDGRVLENTVKENTRLSAQVALEQLFQDKIVKNYLWNKLYRKSLFDGIQFPVGRTFEDIIILPMVIRKAGSVLIIKDIGYHYMEQQGSIVTRAFRLNQWDDYLYALNKKYEYAKQWGVWKDSDRFLANMYLRILDRHLVYSNSTTSQQELLKSLDENINGLHLLRLSPYLAMRRFLCLHGFVFYRCLTKLCFKLKRHNN